MTSYALHTSSAKRTRTLLGLVGLGWMPLDAIAQTFEYTARVIPTPAEVNSLTPRDINNAGEVVGTFYGSPITNQFPFLYSPSAGFMQLPKPPGMERSDPFDINESGVIVGRANPTWDAEGQPSAWRLENNAFAAVIPQSGATGVNDAGTWVSWDCVSGTAFNCYTVRDNAGGQYTISPGDGATTAAIFPYIVLNDAGQIAYESGPGAFRREPDGSITALPPPQPPWTRTFVHAINDRGEVLARWQYTISSTQGFRRYSRAFIWSPELGMVDIGSGASGGSVIGYDLNNAGQVIGESGPHDNNVGNQFVWTAATGRRVLQPLIDPAAEAFVFSVHAINDSGQIVIRAIAGDVPSPRSFILDPVGGACPADLDNDGVFANGGVRDQAIDVNDLLYFLVGFEAGALDLDDDGDPAGAAPDGGTDINDLLFFLARFELGC